MKYAPYSQIEKWEKTNDKKTLEAYLDVLQNHGTEDDEYIIDTIKDMLISMPEDAVQIPESVKFKIYCSPLKQTVTIKIQQNEKINFGSSAPDEEGHSYSNESYILKGLFLECETNNGGCDCDGPINYNRTMEVHVSELNKDKPNWVEKSSEIYDEYARQMNY
jgi:hypothetical protein